MKVDFRWVVITQQGADDLPVLARSSDRVRGWEVAGRVDAYAAGRFRAVTQPGTRRTYKLTLRDVPEGTVTVPGHGPVKPLALLDQWTGTTVTVRDYRGNLFTGIYLAAEVSERRTVGYCDVAVEFAELTTTTGVTDAA